MIFISPTRGRMNLDQVFNELMDFVHELPEEGYTLIIGTDSQPHINRDVVFVTAIIVHRKGKGGRYFYHKRLHPYINSLRQRIYYETFLSLEVASRVTEMLAECGYAGVNIEIHLDIGEKGDTKDIIREVVGMVIGSGYDVRIKPESYGATKVADKYTK